MIVANSPHNPTGRVFTEEELQGIADVCKRHDIIALSDEVSRIVSFNFSFFPFFLCFGNGWNQMQNWCQRMTTFLLTIISFPGCVTSPFYFIFCLKFTMICFALLIFVAVIVQVYECCVFGEHKHRRLADLDGMAQRTLTLGTASKMFSITGWRVGWIVGPEVGLKLPLIVLWTQFPFLFLII